MKSDRWPLAYFPRATSRRLAAAAVAGGRLLCALEHTGGRHRERKILQTPNYPKLTNSNNGFRTIIVVEPSCCYCCKLIGSFPLSLCLLPVSPPSLGDQLSAFADRRADGKRDSGRLASSAS